MSLFNPEGLADLSLEFLELRHRGDMAAATATFARLQQAMRDLIARERAAGDAAATQSLHRVTVGHETVICMVLRTFPAILPEAAAMLTQSYHRLASAYRALDQPMAVGWSFRLAHGGPPRFATEGSCQLPILPAIFDHYFANPIGWFVEVGANDGVTFSNTSGLAKMGWRGLYVEPHPRYFQLCQGRYGRSPTIACENVAIGRAAGEGTISDDGVFSAMSTADPAAGQPSGFKIPIVRLDELLRKHAVPRDLELLVVDVEGQEEAVFDSFDLASWHPRMMIVEFGDLDPRTATDADPRFRLHRKFIAQGYEIVYADPINTVYVAGAAAP
jgi:FkbM family methyltransferase